MKKIVFTFFMSLFCYLSFAQYGEFSINKRGSDYLTKETEQIGHTAFEQRYGLRTYIYSFDVHNGSVSWKFSGPQGKKEGHFRCNKTIEGRIIASECAGVVYWSFAGLFIWQMVEENNKFDSIKYKWAMEALIRSLNYFEEGILTSPNAYQRVKDAYQAIRRAEDGLSEKSLWETLCMYSFALNEHKLMVNDLYEYNF